MCVCFLDLGLHVGDDSRASFRTAYIYIFILYNKEDDKHKGLPLPRFVCRDAGWPRSVDIYIYVYTLLGCVLHYIY